MASVPHILIAGAGYAGLAACLALQDELQRGDVALTVVNGDDRHLLLPELPLYLAGEKGDAQVRLSLSRAVRPPATVRVATIERIEPDGPALICREPEGRLQGDGLLLTLGSVSDDFGVPGVVEHATAIGRWDDMRQLRERLLSDLHSAAASAVAVVGGGFTGVEVASELADRARAGGSGLRVRLVAPALLKGMPREVRGTAASALKALGVEVVQGRAEAVEAGRVRLQGGGAVEADRIVWAAGVRANPVVGQCGLPVDRRGRLCVDRHLRAAPHIYAAGDCADLPDPESGRSAAPTAQAALQSGPAAIRNLWRDLRAEPLQPFTLKDRGFLLSLGHGEAAGEIGTRPVEGGDIALLKRLIETYHAYQVGGVRALARRLLDGGRDGKGTVAAQAPVAAGAPGDRPHPG